MNNASEELLRLATERFGNLTLGERTLLKAIATGAVADFRDGSDDSPADAYTWGPERTINAAVLGWVCTHRDAVEQVDLKNLVIEGAKIQGEFNLAGMSVSCRLNLLKCSIRDGINLEDAQLHTLDLSGSHCGPIHAIGVEVSGSMYLCVGFWAKGSVMLLNASIKGNLACRGGHFENIDGHALGFDGASIGGSVFLDNGFQAHGEVRLLSATINGDLRCSGGRFENAGGDVLNCDGASIGGSVFLNNGFHAEGEVLLSRATLNGDLNGINGHFENTDGTALSCYGALISGNVLLSKGFVAQGQVRLLRTTIAGDLTCAGGCFEHVEGVALLCDRASIGGDVFLSQGFVAQGAVRLPGARINGNLSCVGGRFEHVGKTALMAEAAVIHGNALFRKAGEEPFQTNGIISLWGVDVRRGISFEGAVFNGDGRNGLDATNATIGGPFGWINVTLSSTTLLHLPHAKVGLLDDSRDSWPKAGNLLLDGFVYDGIVGVPLNAQKRKAWVKDRLGWLGRQPDNNFSLQPYEQLSSVLRRAGHEADAKQVLFEKQKVLRQRDRLGFFR